MHYRNCATEAKSAGGAVDLTIVDKDNNEIPMGTGFDSFLPETNTAFLRITAILLSGITEECFIRL